MEIRQLIYVHFVTLITKEMVTNWKQQKIRNAFIALSLLYLVAKFQFEDAINKNLAGEDEEYEETDDFDEDYDAYDDI